MPASEPQELFVARWKRPDGFDRLIHDDFVLHSRKAIRRVVAEYKEKHPDREVVIYRQGVTYLAE